MLNGRRLKVFYVDPKILIMLFMKGEVRLKVDGLPKDARFFGGIWDDRRQTFSICIESDEFEPVELGTLVPEIKINMQTFEIGEKNETNR